MEELRPIIAQLFLLVASWTRRYSVAHVIAPPAINGHNVIAMPLCREPKPAVSATSTEEFGHLAPLGLRQVRFKGGPKDSPRYVLYPCWMKRHLSPPSIEHVWLQSNPRSPPSPLSAQ